jgi:hypothetical protein
VVKQNTVTGDDNMNRKAQTLMIAALALFAAAPVFAGHGHGDDDRHPRHAQRHHGDGYRVAEVRNRLGFQRTRIERGIDNGSLTHKEERKLRKQQHEIRHLARDFREDGYLSRKEHRILTGKLDKASDRIWRLKHNDADRYCRIDGHGKHPVNDKPMPVWKEADRIATVRKLEYGHDGVYR